MASQWRLDFFFLAWGALISVGPAKITPFKCCLFINCTINVQMHEPWVLMVDYTCGSYVSSLSLLQPSGDHSGIVQKRHFLHRATSKPVCPCSWASSFHIQVGSMVGLSIQERAVHPEPTISPFFSLNTSLPLLYIKCGLPCWSSTVVFCNWSSS